MKIKDYKIKGAINRSCPGVHEDDPNWPALSSEQQREMDEARAMLREAADQGHISAQVVMYFEKAARQGHSDGQYNTGCYHRDGRACEQSYERAAEWLEKASQQGQADATWRARNSQRHWAPTNDHAQRPDPGAEQAESEEAQAQSALLMQQWQKIQEVLWRPWMRAPPGRALCRLF